MIVEEKIITDCQAGKRKAYNLLYKKYAAVMLGVCMRYCQNHAEAEDVLQEGFIKIFTNIKNFRYKGSFEGWMKKIMINTSINNYHNNLKHYYHGDVEEIDMVNDINDDDEHILFSHAFPKDKLMNLIQNLPDGYRMVFNLYAVECYTHNEIAEILNISVNTSKSQLFKARRFLRKEIKEIINTDKILFYSGK